MTTPEPAATVDPMEVRRSRGYVGLLVMAALIGIPVAAVAYLFQATVSSLQTWFFASLPADLGFDSVPVWWPVPLLVVSGLLTALAIHRLPGTGGHAPADGFKAGGAPQPAELPGVILAALASLSLGVVLGPEAPLIAIGAGLGVIAVRLAKRDAPPQVATMLAAAGSFAAISTLLGSPLLGAFLLMEAAGLAGPMMGLVLVPGLLAAGVGTLIFLGLDSLTGRGTFSLAVPGLPAFSAITGWLFVWAIAFGLAAAVLGWALRAGALALRPIVDRHPFVLTPVAGGVIAVAAIVFAQISGHPVSYVLFSGQDQLGSLVDGAASWSVGALVLLVACKGFAYSIALSGFRGGPTFPALFIGAAGGLALSGLPGLSLVPAVAMGLGAMCVVMLDLPLTSVLLASAVFASDALQVMPLVIVAVVVAYVAIARLPDAKAWAARRAGAELSAVVTA